MVYKFASFDPARMRDPRPHSGDTVEEMTPLGRNGIVVSTIEQGGRLIARVVWSDGKTEDLLVPGGM